MDEHLTQDDLDALFKGLNINTPVNKKVTCKNDNAGDLLTQDCIDSLLNETVTGSQKNLVEPKSNASISSTESSKSLTQDEIDALLREFDLDV